MDRQKTKTILLIIAAIIYITTSSIAIISTWASGTAEPFDLSLTVSIYVGLKRWTATVYFIGFIISTALLAVFISKTKADLIRRIAFYISFICLIGLSWFPVQYMRPGSPASRGHAFFSNAFFVLVIITLILMLVSSRTILQRIYSVFGMLYGIMYILCYALEFAPFKETILLWESGLIFIYIFEFAFLIKDHSD